MLICFAYKHLVTLMSYDFGLSFVIWNIVNYLFFRLCFPHNVSHYINMFALVVMLLKDGLCRFAYCVYISQLFV